MNPKRIDITLPKSWRELDDSRLYYVYGLFSDNLSLVQVKTYCFFAWSKIKITCRYGDGFLARFGKEEFYLSPVTVAAASRNLDWLGEIPERPVRVSRIKGCDAAHAELVGFPFDRYLYCENLYQGYLQTQNQALLVEMAFLLYDHENLALNQNEKVSVFYWWISIKALFAKQWPNFFQSVGDDGNLFMAGASHAPTQRELQDAMNAQIRALTGGDITKEKQVLSMDTWRALTELDYKAKEAAELQSKIKK